MTIPPLVRKEYQDNVLILNVAAFTFIDLEMDVYKRKERLEERKETPLLELLEDLGGWPMLSSSREGWTPIRLHWVELMARLRLFNNDIFFSMWVGPDGKKSDSHVIQVNKQFNILFIYF